MALKTGLKTRGPVMLTLNVTSEPTQEVNAKRKVGTGQEWDHLHLSQQDHQTAMHTLSSCVACIPVIIY